MIENGTVLQNRYLIEKQIGAGGMGAVYLAVDQRFESRVAIKETFYQDDEFGEAFEREAKLLNSLLHPVLPHVSDYFTENDGYFLVMQFIEGEDLSAILKSNGAFPVVDVLRWTDSLLDALDYLHSQEPPIIHRDIKPHNLKLTARGDIFLLDFGLAKLKSEDTTGGISVFGYSRTYSPLEQIQGTGTDARSDIFALGATVYHLLTGKPPIDALARAASIVNGRTDPLQMADEIKSEIPNPIANVLNSALALNPERRFASAKAMRQALGNAVNLRPTETVEDVPEEEIAAVAAVPVIHSVENENFPALEAFAADVAEIKSEADVIAEPLENNPTRDFQTNLTEALPNSTAVVGERTKSTPSYNQPRTGFIALAAALILGSLAVLYFLAGTKSPDVADQLPVVQEVSATNIESVQPNDPDVPTPEIPAEPVSEIVSSVKNKPKVENVVENSKTVNPPVEIDEEPAEIEKPKVAPRIQTPRSAPRQNSRAGNREDYVETRERIVEDLPDIESVFTGERPNRRQNNEARQNRRQERRRAIEQMTDEERREWRRQRRANRNRQPLPF